MRPFPFLLLAVLALGACGDRTASTSDDRFRLERNTEFDGAKLRVFVTLNDGSEASVNTADHVIGAGPGLTPIPGHRAQTWTFLRVAGNDTSVAHALVSWNGGDPADYLMFGWWSQFPDQTPPNLSLRDSERFALVDGPELDHGIVPQLPVAGTASYVGPAGGLYQYQAGSGWGENEGAYVIDEYQGTVNLTADFVDGTLKGCIGCVGDLVTQRAHFASFLGRELIDVGGVAAGYELHLATAIIGEDGMFSRDRVTLRHPERIVTLSEGSWGGAFSSRPDADGNPRLIAGFSGVYFEESDGSLGEMFGSLLGLSESFRLTGRSGPLPGNGG